MAKNFTQLHSTDLAIAVYVEAVEGSLYVLVVLRDGLIECDRAPLVIVDGAVSVEVSPFKQLFGVFNREICPFEALNLLVRIDKLFFRDGAVPILVELLK